MSRRRRQREIERRLRELDRLDATYGLGAHPRRRRPPDWRRLAVPVITGGLFIAILLAVPGLAPVPVRDALGLSPHRLGRVPAAGSTGAHAFLMHQPGNPAAPVTWDPCRPIHYEVNPTGGPDDALDIVESAISEVSRASGLKLEYDGPTSARPQWRSSSEPFPTAPLPVLISWAKASEVPQLAGRVAGIGGASSEATRDGRLRYVTGGVTLDSDSFAAMDTEPHGRDLEQAIVLHELGHLVGLAHVSDRGELMYSDNVGRLDFGPGDRAGLAQLGEGPCF